MLLQHNMTNYNKIIPYQLSFISKYSKNEIKNNDVHNILPLVSLSLYNKHKQHFATNGSYVKFAEISYRVNVICTVVYTF